MVAVDPLSTFISRSPLLQCVWQKAIGFLHNRTLSTTHMLVRAGIPLPAPLLLFQESQPRGFERAVRPKIVVKSAGRDTAQFLTNPGNRTRLVGHQVLRVA